ncbi:hydrogenase maturation nickel metallochaperone HypA [Leptolyngbya sp. AN02str]|uniref:hydrogenase maturation nickel metallochaperone HypA n=1 Tax=Leptolyngbya sp. AN02str TaxID=3423363 RepID=UPI003D31F343
MHEVGMMQNLLNAAVERAKQEGAEQIRVLQLRVGASSGVAPESLQLAFDVVKQGTMAEDAQLRIDRTPSVYYCDNCDRDFEPADPLNECPECHRISTNIRQGNEFTLEFLDVS